MSHADPLQTSSVLLVRRRVERPDFDDPVRHRARAAGGDSYGLIQAGGFNQSKSSYGKLGFPIGAFRQNDAARAVISNLNGIARATDYVAPAKTLSVRRMSRVAN